MKCMIEHGGVYFGPFSTLINARRWANKALPDGGWRVVKLTDPRDAPDGK